MQLERGSQGVKHQTAELLSNYQIKILFLNLQLRLISIKLRAFPLLNGGKTIVEDERLYTSHKSELGRWPKELIVVEV